MILYILSLSLYIYMSYGQTLVHGKGTSLSRVGPIGFAVMALWSYLYLSDTHIDICRRKNIKICLWTIYIHIIRYEYNYVQLITISGRLTSNTRTNNILLKHNEDLASKYTSLTNLKMKTDHMGVSLMVSPKHPKMIIFSRKTHGCWVPPF